MNDSFDRKTVEQITRIGTQLEILSKQLDDVKRVLFGNGRPGLVTEMHELGTSLKSVRGELKRGHDGRVATISGRAQMGASFLALLGTVAMAISNWWSTTGAPQ